MSGDAVFSGTTHQGRIIALIGIHILAQMRLGWLSPLDDTPVSVSGETRGPGDDARVEFGARLPALEVQAKHSLTAGKKVDRLLAAVQRGQGLPADTKVIVAVGRGSSATIHRGLASDLDRLRTGRADDLKAEAARLVLHHGAESPLLRRIHIVPIDVDGPQDPEAKVAIHLLSSVLEDPDQAFGAWMVLAEDGDEVCAKRGSRTRKDLVDLLTGAGIRVKPPAKEDRWHRQLDFAEGLVRKRRASTALGVLTEIEDGLRGVSVEPVIGYRLWQLRAAALLQTQRPKEALESASRALDIDPEGIRALVNAAFGAALTGELETARSFADRAIASGPDEPRTWGARLYVAAAAGEALPVAPTSVAASDHYRTVQAEIAFNQQDWDHVVALTDSILKAGNREPGVLHLRVAALVSREANSRAAPVREHSTDAERLATELIDGGERDNPQYVQVLVLRAVARRQLGRPAEAEADLAEAQRLDGSDLDAIRNAVDLKLESGDEDGALQLLRNPSVDSAPFLLAIRARLFILEGDRDAGRQDIEAALRGIATAPEDQATRLAIADSALALDDVDLASRVLEGFGPDTASGVGAALLAGRISFAQGDIDKGLAMYREAVARDQRHGSDYLAELAMRLRRAGRLSDALATFEEAGIEGLDDEPLREYVASAMLANDLARAQSVIDRLLGQGEPPPWALAVATDIALRSDDQDNAIRHLSALIARGHATSQIRISLAKSLWESERFDDAEREIGLLLAMPDADPVDSMQAAELLHAIGRDEKALRVAYDSFRRAHENPLMHRAFGRIFLLAKVEFPKPDVVGPETHVRLRDQHGKELEHTIFTTGPVEPLRGEITVEDAQRLGLIGKRAGDVIVRNEGHWSEERQDVVEVLPAIVHAGRDVTFNFNQRFPSEPSFATSVHVGEMESPRDLAPLLGSLVERRSTAGEVFDLYRQRTLPLGAVVRMLGGSIPEVMDHASRDPVVGGPLPVEWSDEAGWTSSRNNAANATQVILTRSALHTASELDIRDALVAGYTFTAPRSLQTEMRQELREAEQYVRDGQRTMMATDQGFGMVELEAGSAPLQARAEALRSLLGWVNDHVSIEPRPLELVRAAGSRQDQERDFVGHSSYDGLALARHHGFAIYADDLGLRRGAIEGVRPPSFSTVAALYALTERGLIDQRLRDHAVVTLTVRHYVSIRPTPEILMAALSRTPALQRSELGTVFGLLGSGAIRADEAASVVAQTLRAASIAPLHVASPEVVTELVLQRRLRPCRMLPEPAAPVACSRRGLAPLLILVPGDRGGGAPAFDRQDDLKQLADLRHRCEVPIFSPTRAGRL